MFPYAKQYFCRSLQNYLYRSLLFLSTTLYYHQTQTEHSIFLTSPCSLQIRSIFSLCVLNKEMPKSLGTLTCMTYPRFSHDDQPCLTLAPPYHSAPIKVLTLLTILQKPLIVTHLMIGSILWCSF